MTDETKQTLIDVSLRLAERLGVPAAILAALLWMTREAATSVHATILVPIIRSHTEFLDTTRETLARQAETLEELAVGQRLIQRELMIRKDEK
jgi:hypothetical protein